MKKPTQHKKEYTLAELVAGLDVVIQGDPDCIIKGVCTIHQAQAGYITFLMNPLYKKYLDTTEAAAVILCSAEAEFCPVNAVIATDPYFTYAKIAAYFDTKSAIEPGIHPTATIGSGCKIAASASVGSHCVIGNGVKLAANVSIGPGSVIGDHSEIGEESQIDANVTLYHQIIVGKRVIISSGTVIGSDGFGIAKNKGRWHKVPQLGRVVIQDDVEIGSNCSIDRGAIDDTVIEEGVKLDNLIQVGHNARIGANTAIAGHVAIAGSAEIGKNCMIAGCSGVNGHISIADNTVITGMTAVTKSIRESGVYSSGVGGLVTNLEWRKNSARFQRLDHLMQRVKELESTLKDLITERKAT
jgi:UDP-3-O-[3-hydroxymyristoyl] glucosamine N-acyltransferase